METRLLPGSASPLGATVAANGVNFAVYSSRAERIDLCLFDELGLETGRYTLPVRTDHVFHGFLPNAGAGQRYGFRAHGPWEPDRGYRFNPAKMLLDPYAMALDGRTDSTGPLLDYRIAEGGAWLIDEVDSAPAMVKGVVLDRSFDWSGIGKPNTPLHESIVYEAHLKGFTKRMPGVPEALRGTYAGLANVAASDYLKRLGVTAIELLPLHAFLDDAALVERDLTNYWGYNSFAFFAPDPRYAAARDPQGVVDEFKGMVKALHAAGIEVWLDVVYNHTAEANHQGPTISFRGLDNPAYYRLSDASPMHTIDFSGTGNTVNLQHPQVLKLVADSLRYWAVEMQIDGFRFDLAPALGREAPAFDPWSGFFDVLRQDPVLAGVKLIAEPWDLGPDGYQLGNFPSGWSEWNGQYRDTVRAFWRGDDGRIGEFARRFGGSTDLFGAAHRSATASINFVTAHDGFTLRDLVSYREKHNAANGEENRDGHDDNLSLNYGVEGPTNDAAIDVLRGRHQRNMLATLLLSIGVPMLLGGDEIGRTQRGNNNAYCQDNEISWIDWDVSPLNSDLLAFTRRLIELRRCEPVLQRRALLNGERPAPRAERDIVWYRPDGKEMQARDWAVPYARALAVKLAGNAIADLDATTGLPIQGQTLLVLFNASDNGVLFRLPRGANRVGAAWEPLIDTTDPRGEPGLIAMPGGVPVTVPDRTLMLFRELPSRPRSRGKGTTTT
ncbi:MAG: glycogen debranching protein GlgX [Thermomicrobiales bacterium]|nr:glycogen debranching protein GlgX [Thermomicrobiales bacterium]